MNLGVPPATPNAPIGIYPIEVMIQPVELRFKFHFEGTRGTNRLDKVRNDDHEVFSPM